MRKCRSKGGRSKCRKSSFKSKTRGGSRSKRRHLRFRAGSSEQHAAQPNVLEPPDDCSMCLEVMDPSQKLFLWSCEKHFTHDRCLRRYVSHYPNQISFPCPICRQSTIVPPLLITNTFESLHAFIIELEEDVTNVNIWNKIPTTRLTSDELDAIIAAIRSKKRLVFLEPAMKLARKQIWIGDNTEHWNDSPKNALLFCTLDQIVLRHLATLDRRRLNGMTINIHDYAELDHDAVSSILTRFQKQWRCISLTRIKRILSMPAYVRRINIDISDAEKVDTSLTRTPYSLNIQNYTCEPIFFDSLPAHTTLTVLQLTYLDWTQELMQALIRAIGTIKISRIMVNMCRRFFETKEDVYNFINAIYASQITHVSLGISGCCSAQDRSLPSVVRTYIAHMKKSQKTNSHPSIIFD